jgi:hypothetical protein
MVPPIRSFAAVVLLDEFEKAHPRVWDLFLQVFDDRRRIDAAAAVARCWCLPSASFRFFINLARKSVSPMTLVLEELDQPQAITTKSMPVAEQPLGPSVPAGSALRPSAVVLEGQFGRLEKLNPACHGDDLWHATAGHDRIWTYMSYGPFADAKTFSRWLVERAALADPFAYAVINQMGRAVGIMTLRDIRPEMRVIEVGHIVYSPELQGTPLGTEAQYLLARYVFEELGYRRYEWRCNTLNAASHIGRLKPKKSRRRDRVGSC